MKPRTVRRSLGGALVLGGVVAVAGLVGAVASEAPFPAVLQPLLAFVVIAATVGGLTGPLIVPLVRRLLGGGSDPPPSS